MLVMGFQFCLLKGYCKNFNMWLIMIIQNHQK